MLDAPSLVFYPGADLHRHGLNPFGEPIYRVIWAPSRITRIGKDRPVLIPMYSGPLALEPVGNHWVLEGWKSTLEYTGGQTAEQWDRDAANSALGPYPSRGEYCMHEAFSVPPSSSGIDWVISLIEAGKQRRPIENTLAIEKNLEVSIRAKKLEFDARIRDRMLRWPAQAVSSARFSKGTKADHRRLTNREAGLPGPGETRARRSRLGYRVLVGDNQVRQA